MSSPVRALLLDIGGVLLSKGWDHGARRRAAERFHYDHEEVEERHQMVFHIYEEGDMTLDRYLDQVVFFRPRDFAHEDYRSFMFAQSAPYPDMLDLFPWLKAKHRLKIVALSNEGRELAVYRARSFELSSFIDFFVFSCFVHSRKPDLKIYHAALDQMLLPLDELVYIDDSALLADTGRSLGIPTIHHTGHDSTVAELANKGLSL